jgi:hypothetical protein
MATTQVVMSHEGTLIVVRRSFDFSLIYVGRGLRRPLFMSCSVDANNTKKRHVLQEHEPMSSNHLNVNFNIKTSLQLHIL